MNFYNNNFKEFSNTRFALWKSVHDFSNQFTKNSNILDAGCGNGKNIKHLSHKVNSIVGFDSCIKFVELCNKKGFNVIEADIKNTPYNDNSFDFIICVAVIHHLHYESDRILAVHELLRVLKPNGKILITCWALESDIYSDKKKFVKGDNNVLFNGKNRYYYIYDKSLFNIFCNTFKCEKYVYWEKGNWNLILTKNSN